MTALHKFTVPALQAIDIEDLLGWTYRIQQADMVIKETSSTKRAAEAMLAGRGALPCAPDLFVVHADARAVHGVVSDKRVLDVPFQRLLIEHARKGERPDWCADIVPQPRMRPALDGRGNPRWNQHERRPEPAIVWIDASGAPVPKGGLHNYGYCVVDYVPSWEFIQAARDIYRAWRASLYEIYVALQAVDLTRWTALPPRAPAQPWQQGG